MQKNRFGNSNPLIAPKGIALQVKALFMAKCFQLDQVNMYVRHELERWGLSNEVTDDVLQTVVSIVSDRVISCLDDSDFDDPKEKFKLLSINEIAKLAGRDVGTVHSWKKDDPNFPKPIAQGHKTKRWLKQEVEQYLRRRAINTEDPADLQPKTLKLNEKDALTEPQKQFVMLSIAQCSLDVLQRCLSKKGFKKLVASDSPLVIPDISVLRSTLVRRLLGVSRPTFNKINKDPNFPKLDSGRKRYKVVEIRYWLESRKPKK